MATTYKTPGVYIEEIPKFPPSIAAVETAIPAFIGYTEKAIRNGETLKLKPTRIESIAEYEEFFGGGPSQNVNVYLDSGFNFLHAEAEKGFYLFDSLRMFYANGGGNCYIVSVGPYPLGNGSPSKIEIEEGIIALKNEDEPTIIILPDAVSLVSPELYDLQKTALEQCNRLMDRVVLCDLAKVDSDFTFKDSVDEFRDNVGIRYLKYGASYGPWVISSFPRQLTDKNIKLFDNATIPSSIKLEDLTTDPTILGIIAKLKIAKDTSDVLTSPQTFDQDLQSAILGFPTTGTILLADYENALKAFSGVLEAICSAISTAEQMELGKDIVNLFLINNPALKAAVLELISYQNEYFDDATTNNSTPNPFLNINPVSTSFRNVMNVVRIVDADLTTATPPLPVNGSNKDDAEVTSATAITACSSAIDLYNLLKSSLATFNIASEEKNLNDALISSFGKYKELISKASEALNTIPPSGAIAGVYASVDRERGVWKAPANVSLNAVIGPAIKISHEQQGEYNVDVNAGKSINIIRPFTGKGTLVWGARTLAGNDNEWRYINVRRFFNMVEESTKKATEQFVFEPNDANTWVKVQAMIENFLTTLWRQGALQGVKPEHAFYVAVGLGKTMTALDILEGRMIVEIGMAAVRPAEFIILRFSQKLAES